MLKKSERVIVSGECIVEEKVISVFTALIDKDNPEKMTVTMTKKDEEAYKEHRSTCRSDYAEFEDYAYMRQAELL